MKDLLKMNIKNEKASSDTNRNIVKDSIVADVLQTDNNTPFSFSKIVKDVGLQTLKALKSLVLVLLIFGLPNILFITISLYKQGNKTVEGSSLGLFIILAVTLISIIFALYSTYKYLLIDTLYIAYKYLSPLFEKICIKIIDKAIAGGNKLLGKRDIDQILNVGALMIEVYGKKLPSYLQKAVIFILRRVPFSDFLFNMQEDLKNGRKDTKTLSQTLHAQLDTYINNCFFASNSMKWIAWFLPSNIIIQIIILVLL